MLTARVVVQESEGTRKLRLTKERVRKHRKLHPRTRSSLTDEELDRIRKQGRDSQRRYREKKKQNAAAENEAQLHAGKN